MASTIILPIVAAIICFILTPVVIMVVVLINRNMKKVDIPANAGIIDTTTRTPFTNGYSLGLIKTQIPRKNDTVYVEMFPLDPKQGWNIPRPEMQKLVIHKDFLDRYASGERSSHRERIDVLPRSKLDLPKKMRDNDTGKHLTVQGQLAHLTKSLGSQFILGGDQAIKSMLRVVGNRGEMSSASFAQLMQENSKMRETFKFEKLNSDSKGK